MRDEDFFGRRRQREELLDALDRRQPTQILGERRVGKSSLLRWVERHAPAGLPVAWINAQGLDGRSPVDLVQAAARALGRLDDVEACLFTFRFHVPARAAERALHLLVPALLLVDEAEALTRPDHGFDRDFLDTLRARGQEANPSQRIVWISASRVDLRALFGQTGLTSSFLNDSRTVLTSGLEPDAARALLRRGVPASDLVDRAIEEAGGFAMGLQSLGDELWRLPSDADRVFGLFDVWARPFFETWWDDLEPQDRNLLKQCAHTDASTGALGVSEHRRARALTARGLLAELDGRFIVSGAAWRRFVDGR